MEQARRLARGREADTGQARFSLNEIVQSNVVPYTKFLGYHTVAARITTFLHVFVLEKDSYAPGFAGPGDEVAVAVRETPFYAEAGGQVGDKGHIKTQEAVIRVYDTVKVGDVHFHLGEVQAGRVHSEDAVEVSLEVDVEQRRPTMQNHTATHVLNWALREVLGSHIDQKGSLVDPEKTRFDFSHPKPVTIDQLERIEELCNEYIQADRPCNIEEVDKDKALAISSLRAVFGEQYPDRVRVISIGGDIDAMVADPKNEEWMKYSVELCGGTHCRRSGEIERFALISEEGVAKGIRRVVGISGEAARKAEAEGQALLDELKSFSAAPSGEFADRLRAFQQKVEDAVIPVRLRHEIRERITKLQKQVKKQEKAAASDAAGEVMHRVAGLLEEADTIGSVTMVVGEVPQAPPEALRSAIDWIRNKTEASAVLLTCSDGEKVTVVAGMSKAAVRKGIKAGDLIREVAPLVGGRGGGRPDMAQGGGNNPGGIPEAIDRAKAWIAERAS
jgi:alanyl-tRNA synthetase